MLQAEVLDCLLKAASRLQGELEAAFEEAGLSQAQYALLRALETAGEDGLNCREVSRSLSTRDPDVTRLVDRLQARGWVSRRRDGLDRRVVRIRISFVGRQVLHRVAPSVRALHARQRTRLEEAEMRRLMELLEALQG